MPSLTINRSTRIKIKAIVDGTWRVCLPAYPKDIPYLEVAQIAHTSYLEAFQCAQAWVRLLEPKPETSEPTLAR